MMTNEGSQDEQPQPLQSQKAAVVTAPLHAKSGVQSEDEKGKDNDITQVSSADQSEIDQFAPFVMVREFRKKALLQPKFGRQNALSEERLQGSINYLEIKETLESIDGLQLTKTETQNFLALLLVKFEKFHLPQNLYAYDSNWYSSAFLYLNIVGKYYELSSSELKAQLLPLLMQLQNAIITTLNMQIPFMGRSSKIAFAHQHGEAMDVIRRSILMLEDEFDKHYQFTEDTSPSATSVPEAAPMPEVAALASSSSALVSEVEDKKQHDQQAVEKSPSQLKNRIKEFDKCIDDLLARCDEVIKEKTSFSRDIESLGSKIKVGTDAQVKASVQQAIDALLKALEVLPGKEWIASTQDIVQRMVKEATEIAEEFNKRRIALLGDKESEPVAYTDMQLQTWHPNAIAAGSWSNLYAYTAMQLNVVMNMLRLKVVTISSTLQREPEFVKALAEQNTKAKSLFQSNLEGIIHTVSQKLASVWQQQADIFNQQATEEIKAQEARTQPPAIPLGRPESSDQAAHNLESFEDQFGKARPARPLQRSATVMPAKGEKMMLVRGVTFMSSDGPGLRDAKIPEQSELFRTLSMDPVRLSKVKAALYGKRSDEDGVKRTRSGLENLADKLFRRTLGRSHSFKSGPG